MVPSSPAAIINDCDQGDGKTFLDLTTDTGGLITGITYTDDHSVLPSKSILMFIALICALLLFANVLRRTWVQSYVPEHMLARQSTSS